jgi:polyhydroxyalkanoate synthase
VAREALRHLTRMTDGIDAWQRHPWRREMTEPPILWRRGAARILDYGATADAGRAGRPVLVVPSLVNRAYVLDLHPRRSMLRFLAAQGLRPLLLDWGSPGLAERDFTLSDYMRLRLAPALEAARNLSPDGEAPAAVGYCMGGSLAAAVAAAGRDRISRLALIGAPWDFACLQGVGAAMVSLGRADDRAAMALRMDAIGAQFGALPVDALQLVFAALDPTLAFRKFRAFASLPPDSPRAEMFAATEDWLNDGVALAIPAAKELLFDWYLDNAMGRGAWAPEGVAARPRAIAAPVLAFCSRNDRIAPGPCAEALPAAIPHARILRPATGHVGMIIGGSAEREVWRPLAGFLSGR